MLRILALVVAAAAALAACSSSVAVHWYQSPSGYRFSYPAAWQARPAGTGSFSAEAADGSEYILAMVLPGSPAAVLAAHREQLAERSHRFAQKQVQVGVGSVPELWSSRDEDQGRVGIYQQYFVAVSGGTLWLQHGCFEHGPEMANELADRDCDDAGLTILRSLST